ncbi:MAG: ATP-binding protein [Eggerthella lenta]
MTISNPGGFVEGITYENLLTVPPHGRNPLLAEALKRVGLAEKTGRGGIVYPGFPAVWPAASRLFCFYRE